MKYLIAFSRLNSLLELLLHAVYTKSDELYLKSTITCTVSVEQAIKPCSKGLFMTSFWCVCFIQFATYQKYNVSSNEDLTRHFITIYIVSYYTMV